MNRERFIDKLKDLYYRDKNCLEELITAYDEKDKEIERLNNIINELEKWLRNEYSKYNGAIRIANVLDKIKELKGSESNE